MNVNLFQNSLNQSIEAITIFFEELVDVAVKRALTISREVAKATEAFRSPIAFTELQVTLLKVLIFIFITNLILIGCYWRKYGNVITDKFVRPSTLKEIEELKLSVAKLKLPKEHSPRI